MLSTTFTTNGFPTMVTHLCEITSLSCLSYACQRWLYVPWLCLRICRAHTLPSASVWIRRAEDFQVDWRSFDWSRKSQHRRMEHDSIHGRQDLSVRHIESEQQRHEHLHRPQRSSVIRSRHNLQNVCWQGNCSGSRKISRQMGLKVISMKMRAWHWCLSHHVSNWRMDFELRLDSMVLVLVLELDVLSMTSDMS